ncbi:hypothetical protein ACCO45_008170 [Purpureocillium lilacinum]|uniref:Uncharacterized protein n=1 Tax=Purpureocillium lilacinum TaxID=33203 RepID=A0ACC4DMK6_PURLI
MLQRNAIDETHCSHLLSNGMGAHRAAKFRTGVHHEYDCDALAVSPASRLPTDLLVAEEALVLELSAPPPKVPRRDQKQSYPLKLLANSWQPAESRRSQNLPARRAEPPASKPVTRSKDQDDTRDSLAEVDRASEPRGATPSLRAPRMSQEVATSHGNTRACPCCVRLRNWVQSMTTRRGAYEPARVPPQEICSPGCCGCGEGLRNMPTAKGTSKHPIMRAPHPQYPGEQK